MAKRGRPKKIKTSEPVITKKAEPQDLFKFVTDLLGRDLTDKESEILVESAKTFVSESYLPHQIFDNDVLKEVVLGLEIVKKSDFFDYNSDSDENYPDAPEEDFHSGYGYDKEDGNEF